MSKKNAPPPRPIAQAYALAREAYAASGIDTDAAIRKALSIPISLHCWQADDVAGLEPKEEATAGGGILATGSYPGRARNGDEIRADLDTVLGLLPGKHRFNIHAFYAETGGAKVDRDRLEPAHFAKWIAWARSRRLGLDFNPTYFAHPMANDGYTLSHPDKKVRDFWIRHGRACRRIASAMGRDLRSPCVLNHWVPDGAKDSPADRWSPRQRLAASFDAVLKKDPQVDPKLCIDSVEGKLFGIGSEDYVVGSHEFYTAYSLTRRVLQCLDMGHFHPTESVADKISALMAFQPRLLLHVSRPIRWDSDHIVIFNDDLRAVFLELVRGKALDRAFVALDFFDASINRLAAYVIGVRATRQAILYALLDPASLLRDAEAAGNGARKLALMEAAKTLPFGAVWDALCAEAGVPLGHAWVDRVESYEQKVLKDRQ